MRTLTIASALLLLGACATVGATLGSGVGDRLVKEPPYAAGAPADADELPPLAHLPIAYQRGAEQEPMFDPREEAASALLAEMNAFLDSLGISTPVLAGAPPRGTAPDVRFGCEQDVEGECRSESRDVSVQGKPWMRLAVGRPSESWVVPVRGAMDEVGAGAVLVITLEVGQYWTHQRNLRGDKEVLLGTDHAARVPWLTSLDRPAQVLQLTGALLDRDGRAIRIGAEGLLARRTNLLVGALGAQEILTEEDVERVRTLRRDDLPARPLVWRVAMRNLLRNLTGEPSATLEY